MKASFSAWKQGSRYYAPLLVVGAVSLALGYHYIGVPVTLAGLCVLGFFRDPQRPIKAEPNELVSPADGLVVGLDDLEASPYYSGPCKRLSIFLSVLNVHVNRAPLDGTITAIDYKPGQFLNALKEESSEHNESNAVHLDTEYGPVTVRQISGAIARRIICIPKVGERLAKGEKFGMIQFGSRTELFLPPNAQFTVQLKQKVAAGTTLVARF